MLYRSERESADYLVSQVSPTTKILTGHWIDQLRTLAPQSVHCVVTSPPYWGLRAYLPEDHPLKSFELGHEDHPDRYIQNLCDGFQEVRRVLRDDGTLWLNLGDTRATNGGKVGQCPGGGAQGEAFKAHFGKHTAGSAPAMHSLTQRNRLPIRGLPPKNLIGLPWRVALELQRLGWYLRSDIIWHKSNPMPESVTDRPTQAHEYLFLLTKSEDYFYDAFAIREPTSGTAHDRGGGINPKAKGMMRERAAGREESKPNPSQSNIRPKQNASFSAAVTKTSLYRNKRDVWTIASESYPGDHYATFPRALVQPCILAGTSAYGVCPNCGAPWRRVLESAKVGKRPTNGKHSKDPGMAAFAMAAGTKAARAAGGGDHDNPFPPKQTVGWKPSCDCNHIAVLPATVLDCFAGTFTVGQVALALGRSAIGIDLNPEYSAQGDIRSNVTPGLPLPI